MSDNTKNNHISVPIWLKTTLTIREAAEFKKVSSQKTWEILKKEPVCDTLIELY